MHAALHLLMFLPALLVVGLIAFQAKQTKLRAAEPRSIERFATLNSSGEPAATRNWRLGLLATALPILGTAALLKLRWQTIPERFPIHWGIDGQPNGWTHRSLGSTFGLLLLAAILIVFLAGLGELASRSSPGHQGRAAMLRTMRGILLAVSWFLTLLFCAISLLPLAQNPTNLVPLVTTASILFSIGVLLFVGYRSITMSETVASSQNTTEARFWKAGLFYINPDDSALMVPKRHGFGYTLNFGRPVSWLIFATILLIPLILPILFHTHTRH